MWTITDVALAGVFGLSIGIGLVVGVFVSRAIGRYLDQDRKQD